MVIMNSGSSESLPMTQINQGGKYHTVPMPPTTTTTPPSCFRRLQYWVIGQTDSPELIDTIVKGRYDDCVKLLEKGFININTQDEKTGKTALHYAAKSGKLEFLNLLLEFNACCNTVDGQGNTPLHLAILHGQRDCCKRILECDNLDVNLGNNVQETPLHVAVKNGDMNIIDMLNDMKPDYNRVDSLGNTILHIAAEGQPVSLCYKLKFNATMINEKNNEENTPLHLAAKAGNSDVIDFLRSHQADCNTQNYSGDTPLHLAAKGGHLSCIKEILKYDNLEIDLINNSKCTPLHSAVKIGNLDIVGQLLDHKANYNALDSSGDTPLHLAVTKGHYSCCEKLLQCEELMINKMNKAHETPLHMAAKTHGRKNECNLILQHPDVKIDMVKKKVHQSPLHLAAQVNNYEVVDLLLKKGADWKMRDKYSYMPLHYAAEHGSEKSCKYLMEVIIRFNYLENLKLRDKKTPMMLAAKGGFNHCCEILPSNDIDVQDDDGNTALFYATKGDFLNTVTMLLTKNAKTTIKDKAGRTVLHLAAMNKADACLSHLLQIPNTKDLVNVKDNIKEKRYTPLHEAIINEALACAELLLMHGASVKDRCQGGMTALHLAVKQKDPGICSLLMSYESDANEVNDEQETPLHVAAKYGSRDVCKILMRKRTQVLTKDKNGRTALHHAAEKGHDQVVTLLTTKISSHFKDDDDSTALHLAAANGHLKCCDILIKKVKHIINDVDKENKLAVDRAFENKHDEVFAFLIKILKPKKEIAVGTSPSGPLKHKNTLENEARRNRFHKYMHQSLKPENHDKPREIAAEGIIESKWWEAGFFTEGNNNNINTKMKTQYCTNFRELVNHHPDLALKTQDRCCEHIKGKKDMKRDFRLFQDHDHFCSESESSKKPGMTHGQRLLLDHPVSLMVQHTRDELLRHQLTDDWLMHLWSTYISYILTFLLVTQILYLLAIHIFMENVDNWTHIQHKCKTTHEEFCRLTSLPGKASTDLSPEAIDEEAVFSMMISSNSSNSSSISICYKQYSQGQLLARIYLLIMTCFILITEVICFLRLWRRYFTVKRIMRIVQLILTMIPLLSVGICGLEHQVLNTWQWYCGIAALLLEWLIFFDKLNELPVFFIFMPVTNFFLWNYMKALGFILLLLFAFSYIFHLLLADQDGFGSMSESMMKMIVWLLGDLNYDDTFIEGTVVYPDMAKLMFVGFIIIMGGFIANLAIGQPSDRLDRFRKNAAFSQKSSQAILFLEIKACFPTTEKLITKVFGGEGCRLNFLFNKMATKIFTPTIVDEEDTKEDTTLQNLEEQVATLVDLCKEQKEEMRDLKQKLNNLFRRMPELNQTDRSSRKVSQLIQ